MSTTTSHEVALTFLNADQPTRENHERVLLEIDADPRVVGSKPFLQLGSLRHGTDKHEVLFMFGSVFLINAITCSNDGVYTIELTLYSDAEHEFKPFFDGMARKYADKEIDLLAFAQILFDLDRFNEVEDYVQDYLDQLPQDHVDTVRCFRLLGATALAQEAYDTSLNWYNQSLELNARKLPQSVNPNLADDHENIAHVHFKRGSYDLALRHYTTCLEMRTAFLPAQHPSIARTLENLGRVYESKHDLSQALAYFNRARTMYRSTYPATDENLLRIDECIRRLSTSSQY